MLDFAQLYRAVLTEAVQISNVNSAIVDGRMIKIWYEGDETTSPGFRIIVPFVYGVTRDRKGSGGNAVIRAWQTSGKSDTARGDGKDPFKRIPGWRLFRLDRIKSWANVASGNVSDPYKKFRDAKADYNYFVQSGGLNSYNPNDQQMSSVLKSLNPNVFNPAPTTPAATAEPVAEAARRLIFDTFAVKKLFRNDSDA